MKIIKKIALITPLMLSISTISPISCANSAGLAKSSTFSDSSVKDLKNSNTLQDETQYVTHLEVTNEEELCGVQIGTKTKIQMGITPEDATDKSLEFESSNPDVAVVEDGCVVAKSNGHTEITVRANMSCPQHSISTFFYVNVYTEGCKVTFTSDENGTVTKSYVNAQVGSNFSDIIHNYDISCIPNEGYKFDDWYDMNGNVANFLIPITSDATIKAAFKRLVFETDSWQNIIKFADQGLDKLKEIYQVDTFVGRTKNIYINGYRHELRVIGENHDTCTETGKKAALTFQLTTLLSGTDGKALQTCWSLNRNCNYTQGYLRGNLNGTSGKQSWDTTAYEMLPSDLRKGIKKVNKTVWEWDFVSEDGRYVDYNDYLFALTCTEFAQAKTDKDEKFCTEGKPYKYWVDNNYFNARIFFDANWVNKRYWLASPFASEDNSTGPLRFLSDLIAAWYMPDFNQYSYEDIEINYAVSFGFCI